MNGKRNVSSLINVVCLMLVLAGLQPSEAGAAVVTNLAVRDTYIRGDGAQLSDGSLLSVADWAGSPADLTRHTVISFDLSSFDISAGFLSATLKLGQPTSGAAGTHNVNRLLRDFIAAEVDFNEYTTGNNWLTPGAVGASDSVQIATGVASGASTGGDWAGGGLDVTAAANAWVAAGDTTQLGFLILPVTKYQNYVYEDKEGGNSPVLVFQVVVPAPAGTVITVR